MHIKPISILALVLLTLSCGSSKQIASTTKTENTIQKEDQKSDIDVVQEVVETVIIETPSEIEVREIETIQEVEVEHKITETETFNHDLWNSLLQKHVSDQGNVNYKGFKADKTEFNSYLKSLSETPPQDSWSKDETLAYWMNVYNAFTIKLILDNYPINSIKDIDGPWNHRFIKIGDKWYTLNDVEHKIIRKMDEPRIHFALVCAAVSCPKLYNKAFTAKNLEADFVLLTKGFLSDSSKNEIFENEIKLSKIFKWYGGDFKSNGKDLIDFLNEYSDVTISDKAKKSYKDYNWNLNE
ncbi:DUF547 domain-containing protein [Psychroserpens ponticola]|uniref:DUF547 domain-containing protein n=1 Tax=Psychroserpens ponticola TaxID=2932268 RepID=A0ABY7RWZ7_9FLAO|nr:DUF547 domain-containing protein [Psychroserpens ponticola]WCO01220.1 DUF547 domain-containing protein [Psychroserpens ponticola]